ncbi:unnamed protein product [Acanthoscelides obtectus]|uniref:Uncharacterized protein n=1 Tax=Acanthoscelides obtectus TaxID=200917 RepID=A0A9P0K794_ACAOB|nr:unnamed protein product [Acanthoscelides obtectus]CAK1665863.1 hypothetical protein AOBTE_LOCUS25012 [Acanthoscelides obtectus]
MARTGCGSGRGLAGHCTTTNQDRWRHLAVRHRGSLRSETHRKNQENPPQVHTTMVTYWSIWTTTELISNL